MRMPSRRRALFLALAATLLAAFFAPPEEESVAMPTRMVAMPSAASQQVRGSAPKAAEEVLRIVPRQSSDRLGVLFPSVELERSEPVTTVVPELPPPRPTAPVLPFRVFGYYEEKGLSSVFLEDRGESLVVKVGDTLRNDTYRVDSISNGQLRLTYLPLGQQQTLWLGEHK